MTASLLSAIVGGVFIGLAATWLYLSLGRIAGISGIAARALTGASWPILFIVGLGIGGWAATLVTDAKATNAVAAIASQTPPAVLSIAAPSIHWVSLIFGGLLVGFGTRLGSGCTSGHGVCGIARLSPRSITATCVFLGTGMFVATTISAFGL